MNKLTYAKVKHCIEKEYSNNNKLLSQEYVTAKTKMEIRCKCGNTYTSSLDEFRRYENKRRCKKCNNKIKLYQSHRNFINKLYDKYRCNYSVLDLYKHCKKKLSVKHTLCGHVWKVTPDVLLNEDYKGCPNCSQKKANKSNSVNYKFVKNFVEREGYFLLSSDYNNAKSIIQLKCPNDHIYEVDWNHFKNCNNRCPSCRNNHKKSYEEIKSYIESEHYILVDTSYINSNNRLHLICPENHNYYVTWNDFHSGGNRCTTCNNSSKGERAITIYLNNNNINFTSQYRIKDCSYIRPLPFDFAIFDNNNNLKLLIEYDGIQHFEAKKAFGGVKCFERTKRNDRIKNEFCKREKIILIRIPYWEFKNIEIILNQKLINYINWGSQKVI